MPLVSYWTRFVDAFIDEISSLPNEALSEAWQSSANRTRLYEHRVLPQVASKMSLRFKKEEFRVDFTFCKAVLDTYEVPVIFIESENIATSAHHEIRKLCCLHAPLKVLIVCAEWSDEPGAWPHGGCKQVLLEQWRQQINAHNREWASSSTIGIIVAEWNQLLRYYAVAFNHFGDVVDDHRIIFEREVTQEQAVPPGA